MDPSQKPVDISSMWTIIKSTFHSMFLTLPHMSMRHSQSNRYVEAASREFLKPIGVMRCIDGRGVLGSAWIILDRSQSTIRFKWWVHDQVGKTLMRKRSLVKGRRLVKNTSYSLQEQVPSCPDPRSQATEANLFGDDDKKLILAITKQYVSAAWYS